MHKESLIKYADEWIESSKVFDEIAADESTAKENVPTAHISTADEASLKENGRKQVSRKFSRGRKFGDKNDFVVVNKMGKEVVLEHQSKAVEYTQVVEESAAGGHKTISSVAEVMIDLKKSKPIVKGISIQQPSFTPVRAIESSTQDINKGKGKLVEDTDLEIPEELGATFEEDSKLARELGATYEAENQKFLEKQRKDAEKQAKTLALVVAWDEERVQCDAHMVLANKQTQKDMQMYTIEEKNEWLKRYMEERRNLYVAERLKKKQLRPPTVKQRRMFHETYLKNIKGCTKNQLSHIPDDQVEKMYKTAKEEIDTEGHKKETVEVLDKESSSSGLKRSASVLNTICRKKMKPDKS